MSISTSSGPVIRRAARYPPFKKMAASLFGKASRVHYKLGKVLERIGDKDDATEKYQQFLSLLKDADLDIPEVDDARQRLVGLKGVYMGGVWGITELRELYALSYTSPIYFPFFAKFIQLSCNCSSLCLFPEIHSRDGFYMYSLGYPYTPLVFYCIALIGAFLSQESDIWSHSLASFSTSVDFIV